MKSLISLIVLSLSVSSFAEEPTAPINDLEEYVRVEAEAAEFLRQRELAEQEERAEANRSRIRECYRLQMSGLSEQDPSCKERLQNAGLFERKVYYDGQ